MSDNLTKIKLIALKAKNPKKLLEESNQITLLSEHLLYKSPDNITRKLLRYSLNEFIASCERLRESTRFANIYSSFDWKSYQKQDEIETKEKFGSLHNSIILLVLEKDKDIKTELENTKKDIITLKKKANLTKNIDNLLNVLTALLIRFEELEMLLGNFFLIISDDPEYLLFLDNLNELYRSTQKARESQEFSNIKFKKDWEKFLLEDLNHALKNLEKAIYLIIRLLNKK